MKMHPSFSRCFTIFSLFFSITLLSTNLLAANNETRGEAAFIDNMGERPEVPISAGIPGFMRGNNLGNWFDSPRGEPWRSERMREDHLRHLAALGFDHVRLPVRFSDYADHFAPYTIEPHFMQEIDTAIRWAMDHQLNVILDMHHYMEIMHSPRAHEERFLGMWQQLADRYKSYPTSRLAFELLNEPHNKLDEYWNDLVLKGITTVRQTNPDRLLFIDSVYWAASSRVGDLKLPSPSEDPNIIVTFHMYEPFVFTHQGSPWIEPQEMVATRDIRFPGPPATPLPIPAARKGLEWISNWVYEYNTLPLATNPSGPMRVYQEFAHVDELIRAGRLVYLGEFGVIEYADAASRENYVRFIREEAERRNIGWAYWDDGGAFKMMDLNNGDIEYLRRALLDR